jgi:NitT/TauT family transport system substrate-binding protein
VTFKQIPYATSEQALRTHQVDVAAQTTPYNTETAADLGSLTAVDPFAANSAASNMPIAAYVATAAFVHRYPRTIAAFQRAMIKGAGAAGSRTAAEHVLPTYVKISKETAAVMTLPDFPLSLDAKRLDRVVYLMRQYGTDPRPGPAFSTTSMIITTPAP